MKYKFSTGFRAPRGAKAEVVAAEIYEIQQRDNEITPPALVEAARDKQSPLHPFFEWNDGEAAEQYRLYQARTLIRAIVVQRTDEVEEREYVYTIQDGRPCYQPVTAVRVDTDMLAHSRAMLAKELAAALKSVEELERLCAPAVQKKYTSIKGLIQRAGHLLSGV